MTADHHKEGSFRRLTGVQDISGYGREIFFLFYGVFFLCSVMDKIRPGLTPVHALFRLAFFIHPAGVFFALGCMMGLADASRPDFKRKTLKKALHAYLTFFIIGFIEEILTGHDIFTSIKDILIVVRVPDISSVFLSICFLLLLCAYAWNKVEILLESRPLMVLVTVLSLLLTLIPEGFLGYGLVGAFIGGSTTNCVAMGYYLPLFLFGILFARRPYEGLICKRTLTWFIMINLFAGCALLLRLKHPLVVLAGIDIACMGLLICMPLLPLYLKAESAVIRLAAKLRQAFLDFVKSRHQNRAADILTYYGAYTLVFLVTAYFVFYPYITEGRTLIWYIDGIGQYIPKAIRFMKCMPPILRDILHGNLDYQQYDFTTGLGSTFTVSHEPVYWLNLLFSPSQVETAYNLQILLRYYLAGISMSIMLRYYKKSGYASLLCSLVYTFCGYAIFTGTRHGMFLIPLILLPLLIVSMEELITKKKWYLLTVLTAISLLCSYYFLYMNTIALGIYFVVRILCTREYRNIKTFIGRGLIIVGAYLIGTALGSVTLFNSFGGYVGSSRSSGGSVSSFITQSPLFYRPLWISDFFIGFISDFYSPGMWLRIGLAPLGLLALVFVFTRARKKEIKPIFLLLTVFCLVPVFGFILNGFSNVSNRWCYVYIITLVFILAEYLEDFRSLTVTETICMCAITFFYGLIIFFTLKHRTDTGLGAFGLLTLTLLTLILLNEDRIPVSKRGGRLIIMGVTLLAVILNANMYITNTAGENPHIEAYVKNGTSRDKMSVTALRYLDEVTKGKEDQGFYRSTNLYTYGNTRSSSMVYGYNDISVFNSTLNGGIVSYNKEMANSDFNIVSIYSYNFRGIMNELASVRYLGADSLMKMPVPYGYHEVLKKKALTRSYSIYENDYALPLGYTYDSVVSDKEAEKLDAAGRQELSMISAIVEEDKVGEDANIGINRNPDLTVHDLAVKKTKLDNVTMEDGLITVGEGGGSITFLFDGEENAETYVSFDGDILFPEDGAEHFLNCQLLAKDTSYNHRFRVDAYSTGQEEYLFNLGYHKKALKGCTLKFSDPGEDINQLSYKKIRILSQPMDSYGSRAAALAAESLDHVKVEKNTVTGSITTSKDKLLVISLPYQSGWTAYVDGKETPLQRANYQYMAINLPAGSHEIRLHYRLPGQKATILCTGGGLILFAAIILFNFLRKRLRRK